jgi:hypothetical protein
MPDDNNISDFQQVRMPKDKIRISMTLPFMGTLNYILSWGYVIFFGLTLMYHMFTRERNEMLKKYDDEIAEDEERTGLFN